MIIFPAVDLQGGKAVRLRQGRADDTVAKGLGLALAQATRRTRAHVPSTKGSLD